MSLHACIPSLCGMLVYNEDTSRVTRITPVGISLSESSLVKKMGGVFDVRREFTGFGFQVTVDKFKYRLSLRRVIRGKTLA